MFFLLLRCCVGDDAEETVLTPTALPMPDETRIVEISCGYYHSALVSEKGDLFTFGDGDGGKLGHGKQSGQEQCNVPKHVPIKEKVRKEKIRVTAPS